MSTQRSLSGRLKPPIAENGYGTPTSTDGNDTNYSNGVVSKGERRNSFECSGGPTNSTADTLAGTEADTSEWQKKSSERDEEQRDSKKNMRKHVGIRDRVSCYTWTWFTMTMATGGIANVLHTVPYQSDWLRDIGRIFFLLNLVLFIVNCICITLRFRWNPGSFIASFESPSESLFVAPSIISVGTILINFCQYVIPYTGVWSGTIMQVLFWSYVALAFLASSGMYLIMWTTQSFPIHTMTPIWIFPAYPLLLTAPFAASLIEALPDSEAAARINSIGIAFGAICIQGTGFLLSLMIYAAFLYRLMTQKLPRESTRPGMFVSVGPTGFTVAGIVHLGNNIIPKVMHDGFEGHPDAKFLFKILADMLGLWMWGLCMWFFFISLGAHWRMIRHCRDPAEKISFDMTWYSFIFPNTAMITATIALGNTFDSPGLKIFGTTMAGILVIVWLFVFGQMIRSLWLRRLLWPGEFDGAELQTLRWSAKVEAALEDAVEKVLTRAE